LNPGFSSGLSQPLGEAELIKCHECKLATAQCSCDHKGKVTKIDEGSTTIKHNEPTEIKKSFDETKVVSHLEAPKIEKELLAPIIKEHHKDVIHEHHKDVIEETHKNVIHEHHQPVIHEVHQPIIHEKHVHEIHQPIIHKKEIDVIHEKEKKIMEHQTLNKVDVEHKDKVTHEHFEKPIVAEVMQKSPKVVNEGKTTLIEHESGVIEEKEHKGLGTKIKEFFTGKKEDTFEEGLAQDPHNLAALDERPIIQ